MERHKSLPGTWQASEKYMKDERKESLQIITNGGVDRTGGASTGLVAQFVMQSTDMSEFRMVRASKLCSNLILMTAPWRLFWSRDGCVLPTPCLVLGINSVP
jgi:hypothetical protein